MENLEILYRLGLDDRAVKIYSNLLESGPSTISSISQKTGIHRPLIYKALPELRDKGLISLSPKGKQKRYVAESPDRLKQIVSQLAVDLEEIIPELKGRYQTSETRPLVKYLEGKRGITAVFEDLVTTLKRGDIFYRYSSAKNIQRANSYLPHNYREVRDQKQLERFVITSETQATQREPSLGRSIKIVPKGFDLFDHDITQILYGNKIAFIDYNSETAVIIENGILAEFQKRIFRLLFSKL